MRLDDLLFKTLVLLARMAIVVFAVLFAWAAQMGDDRALPWYIAGLLMGLLLFVSFVWIKADAS